MVGRNPWYCCARSNTVDEVCEICPCVNPVGKSLLKCENYVSQQFFVTMCLSGTFPSQGAFFRAWIYSSCGRRCFPIHHHQRTLGWQGWRGEDQSSRGVGATLSSSHTCPSQPQWDPKFRHEAFGKKSLPTLHPTLSIQRQHLERVHEEDICLTCNHMGCDRSSSPRVPHVIPEILSATTSNQSQKCNTQLWPDS